MPVTQAKVDLVNSTLNVVLMHALSVDPGVVVDVVAHMERDARWFVLNTGLSTQNEMTAIGLDAARAFRDFVVALDKMKSKYPELNRLLQNMTPNE